MLLKLAIDILGSDSNPALLLDAILMLFKELEQQIELTVFITPDLASALSHVPQIKTIVVHEVITMEDDPLTAVRRKKNSSISLGIKLLQKKEIDAFISAGNTGAILASAHLNLSLLPGIERAALLTLLPTKHKEIAVIDVGANVTYKVEHLLQFASMGIAYQKSRGISRPTVGLLNIGSEAKKGTPELREAYQRLQMLNQECHEQAPIFIGNIEGRDVFKGNIDVLVTDGFSGNIFLKTSEGIAAFILDLLQENAIEECSPHLKGVLSTLRQRLHYTEYAGAILCGVDGIIVKCHGDASPQSIINSIKETIQLAKHDFIEKIRSQLERVH